MKLVDMGVFPDRASEDYYKALLGSHLRTAIIPNLLSTIQFDGLDKVEVKKDEEEKRRILIVADRDDWDDINSSRSLYDEINAKLPQTKIMVVGNCLNYENKNPLRYARYKHIRYPDLTKYYKTLYEIGAEICIIPVKKQTYYRPYYKLLEVAGLGIPMCSIDDYPFNHLLAKNETILLATQKGKFIRNVQLLLQNEEERQRIGKTSQKFILSKYGYGNKDMVKIFFDVFRPIRKNVTA